MNEPHFCIGVIEDCQNVEESYGEICVHCNKCGRFDAEEVEEQQGENT